MGRPVAGPFPLGHGGAPASAPAAMAPRRALDMAVGSGGGHIHPVAGRTALRSGGAEEIRREGNREDRNRAERHRDRLDRPGHRRDGLRSLSTMIGRSPSLPLPPRRAVC